MITTTTPANLQQSGLKTEENQDLQVITGKGYKAVFPKTAHSSESVENFKALLSE